MKIDVGDHALNCEVRGPKGAPWVTFSHALGNNLELWNGQVSLLEDRFRILRYDQRGHGGSDAPPGPYSFADLMADARGASRPFRHSEDPLGRTLDRRHARLRPRAGARGPAAVAGRLRRPARRAARLRRLFPVSHRHRPRRGDGEHRRADDRALVHPGDPAGEPALPGRHPRGAPHHQPPPGTRDAAKPSSASPSDPASPGSTCRR